MSSIKKLFFLLAKIGVTTFLGVVILELAFGNWFSEDKWKTTKRLNLMRDRQITFQVDNLYGKEMPAVLYTRDKYGLRGSCKDPKEIDILTIGGSTTDQRYIGDGQTFQDILQTYFQNKLNKKVCVSNAGIDGQSTFGHLASFKTWFPLIPDLKPKYFLLYVGINDADFRISPSAGFDFKQTEGESRLRAVLREKSALYGLLTTVSIVLSAITDSRAYAGHHKTPPTINEYIADSPSKDTDALVKKTAAAFSERMDAILAEIKKYDAKPICVSQPHLFATQQNGKLKGTLNVFQYEGQTFNGLDFNESIIALNEVMKPLCTKSGGYFIDITSKQFAQKDFYDAVHMTPEGAARLGKYLFDEFEKQQIPL